MANVIEACRLSRAPKSCVTLYSGGKAATMPDLQNAIRKAIEDDVHVTLVTWSNNVNSFYNELALNVDPGGRALRIRLLEDILFSNPP